VRNGFCNGDQQGSDDNTGVDTNVVVRLVVADDPEQTRRARRLVEQTLSRNEPVLISVLVLLESEWMLRSRYGFSRDSILGIFRTLLEARELSFEDEPALEEALFHWKDSACGFSDCLIAAHHRQLGCRATATFDSKAARLPGTVPV
jgi:predicted nucleic-acid-binding protein